MRNLLLILMVLATALWSIDPGPPPAEREPLPVATFSIVAIDPETGDLGVAVQSKFFGVGAVVPWAKADVGAIATQAFANTTYGPEGLALLDDGISAEDAVARLTADDRGRDRRQVGMVDARGQAAAFTGKRCMDWAGHHVGDGFCCQGNILAGKGVVAAMAKAFEASDADLPERLVAALAAGQRAGGDKRGRQSAALLVVRRAGGYAHWNDRWVDIHVEDHKTPIKELGRLLALWRATMPPARLPEVLSRVVREPHGRASTVRAAHDALRRAYAADPKSLSEADRALARGDYVGTAQIGDIATVYVQVPGQPVLRRMNFTRPEGDQPWERVTK